jgi:hypothetical protein
MQPPNALLLSLLSLLLVEMAAPLRLLHHLTAAGCCLQQQSSQLPAFLSQTRSVYSRLLAPTPAHEGQHLQQLLRAQVELRL